MNVQKGIFKIEEYVKDDKKADGCYWQSSCGPLPRWAAELFNTEKYQDVNSSYCGPLARWGAELFNPVKSQGIIQLYAYDEKIIFPWSPIYKAYWLQINIPVQY